MIRGEGLMTDMCEYKVFIKTAEYTINITWRLLATTNFVLLTEEKNIVLVTKYFKFYGKSILN